MVFIKSVRASLKFCLEEKKNENRGNTGVMTATGVRDLRRAISRLKKLPDKSKFFCSNEHSPALHRLEEMSELTAGCWLMIIRQHERKKKKSCTGCQAGSRTERLDLTVARSQWATAIGCPGCQVTAGLHDLLLGLPGHSWEARSPVEVARCTR